MIEINLIIKYILLFFVAFFVTACAGLGDWEYKLSNNYEVWHINSYEIYLVRKNQYDIYEKIITGYISEFKYNDENIFLKYTNVCERTSSKSNCESLISDAIKNNNFMYAIINISSGVVDDFLTEEQFNEKIKDIDFPSEWIKTNPTPEGANYG